MGQYRLSVNFQWQIGILIKKEIDCITLHIPFVTMFIGLDKSAHGVYFFGLES